MKKKIIQVGGTSKIIEESAAALPVRFKSILHTVMSCGEYDRLMQGTFENYLSVQFKDSQLENVIYGHDWFLFFDLGNQHILQSQIYNVMAYMPYTFVASHLKFASLHRTHIKYPSTPAEMRTQQERSRNLIQTMISDMSPRARVFASPSALVNSLVVITSGGII